MDKGSRETMREERYQAILAAYGADPDKWPEAERAAAMAFSAAGDQAFTKEEAALDALLGAYVAQPAVDDWAMERIAAVVAAAAPNYSPERSNVVQFSAPRAASPRPIRKASVGWFGERRLMAAGFAFAALAGLAIGFVNGADPSATPAAMTATADASGEMLVSYALAEG